MGSFTAAIDLRPRKISRCARLCENPVHASRACYVDVNNPDPKERLPAMRGTAHGRHTYLECAPLYGHKPRDLCLKGRTIKSLSLRFWLSSSRSLGRCLLLGQRSSMNLHTVRPYIHHTSLSTNGCGVSRIKYLTVRPELSRRAPIEFSHSPSFRMTRKEHGIN